jgi:4-amino-4-deoxy-L-arabinose transferase-like glycosyltransferase
VHVEAIAWMAIAAWVLVRVRPDRPSGVEWIYAACFVLFGVTDLVEAMRLPVWLLLVKGLILALILALILMLRRRVVRIRPGRRF